MKKRMCFIFLIIVLTIMSMIPSYADDLAYDANNVPNLSSWITNNYNLTSDDFCIGSSCSSDYAYPIVISFPVKQTYNVKLDINNKEIVTYKTSYPAVNDGHQIGDVVNDNNGSNREWKRYVYIAGYTTVYTKEQLDMSNVDINIIDGKVVVTGVLSDDTAGWNVVYNKYKIVINGFLGMCILSCVAAFIILSMKLGGTAGNPTERKKVMAGILISGVGTAALGGVLLFFSFFWNLL